MVEGTRRLVGQLAGGLGSTYTVSATLSSSVFDAVDPSATTRSRSSSIWTSSL